MLRFFSKTKEDIEKEIVILSDAEEFQVWKQILISFNQIKTPTEILLTVEELWKAIKFENLENQNVLPIKVSISYHLSQLKSFEGSSYQNIFRELTQLFNQLIQAIQPLDVELMIHYVQNNQKAASIIEGKDIVMFLGETDAGKSTTILFLAGSKFNQTWIGGFKHIEPIQVPDFAHELKVRASTRSVTKSITVVEFPNGMVR